MFTSIREMADRAMRDALANGPPVRRGHSSVKAQAVDRPQWKPVPPLKINPTRPRLVITLAVGEEGERTHASTAASQRRYAEKVGADYVVITGKTQSWFMLEKFRFGQYVRHYPGGSLCLDADVWINSHTAPDLFDLVPEDKIGVSIAHDLHWFGLMPKFNAELADVCQSQGVNVPAGSTETHWNSGLVVMRPMHADYWHPPLKPIPRHWCAEELWSKATTFRKGWKLHDLPHPEIHWQWWRDQPMDLIGPPLPPFIHPAGMTQQPEGLRRRLDLFRVLEASTTMTDPAKPTPAFLINLRRRPERLKHALEQFGKTTIQPTVFEAVDGRLADVPPVWSEKGMGGSGAYGCSQSHIKVLSDAIDQDVTEVMVFEDDIIFVDDFTNKFNAFKKTVPPDWDCLFLGGQHMHQTGTREGNVIRCQNVHRTHAYLIRGKYLEFIRDLWRDNPGKHIDHLWGENQLNWKVYAPLNWLVGQTAGKSDISGVEWKSPRMWQSPVLPGNVQSMNLNRRTQPKNCGTCGQFGRRRTNGGQLR